MKKFPIELLKPQKAVLNAKIFKNDFLKIPATLFYIIEIELEELEIENQKINTSIHLDFIKLNNYDLKELENRTFEFPLNPKEGYIDGSIYLYDAHNPIDIPKIEFGNIKNNSIEATIYFNINFEYENTDYTNFTDCTINLDVKFGKLSIDTDIMNANNYTEIAANDLVGSFVALQDYEKATIKTNQIIYKLKNI